MAELLNSQLINDLRNTINRTNIFIKDQDEKDKFEFICATMDRIDSAVSYINKHYTVCPNSEEEFVVYLFYCCNIVETIKTSFQKIRLTQPTSNYFEPVWNSLKNGSTIPLTYTDDNFFAYFRSLVFAHPTDTSRSIPDRLQEENQYSPYILMDKYGILRRKDSIGVEIYSDKRDLFCLTFDFSILNQYIKWKYELLTHIINAFETIINDKEKVWKTHKVDRSGNSIAILNNVKEILEERCMETDIIENLIEYLECESTISQNDESVKKYKDEIISVISRICDTIDEYRHEDIWDITEDILYARPKGHQMMHYQLEKIHCYLNEEGSDVEWGLIQAENFSKGFATKWVKIEPRKMSFIEIKMLTCVACYLEFKEQEGAKYE